MLSVDVGGSHVKALLSTESERRRFVSGPKLTADEMATGTLKAVEGWSWDAVTVGIPAPIRGDNVVHEPVNLGEGWVGFDLIVFGSIYPAVSLWLPSLFH